MGVVLTSLWSRHWGVGGHRSDSCGHGSEPGLWREEEAKEARLCWGQGGEKRTRLQSSRRCSQPSCKIALGGKHSGVGTRKLEYTMRHTRRELPSGWWFYLRRCPQILNSLQRRNTLNASELQASHFLQCRIPGLAQDPVGSELTQVGSQSLHLQQAFTSVPSPFCWHTVKFEKSSTEVLKYMLFINYNVFPPC